MDEFQGYEPTRRRRLEKEIVWEVSRKTFGVVVRMKHPPSGYSDRDTIIRDVGPARVAKIKEALLKRFLSEEILGMHLHQRFRLSESRNVGSPLGTRLGD